MLLQQHKFWFVLNNKITGRPQGSLSGSCLVLDTLLITNLPQIQDAHRPSILLGIRIVWSGCLMRDRSASFLGCLFHYNWEIHSAVVVVDAAAVVVVVTFIPNRLTFTPILWRRSTTHHPYLVLFILSLFPSYVCRMTRNQFYKRNSVLKRVNLVLYSLTRVPTSV